MGKMTFSSVDRNDHIIPEPAKPIRAELLSKYTNHPLSRWGVERLIFLPLYFSVFFFPSLLPRISIEKTDKTEKWGAERWAR